MYDTKIKDFSFKFHADHKKAEVSIDIEMKDEIFRNAYYEKIWSLDRRLYHPRYLGEQEISEPVPFMDKSPQEGYEGLL